MSINNTEVSKELSAGMNYPVQDSNNLFRLAA